MELLKGKSAIVTGGGRGIGRAVSERLLSEGAKVLVAQRSAPNFSEVDFIHADFADPVAVARVVDYAVMRFGALDILVNNAGMMMERGVEEMTIGEWQQTLSVNLTAPFLLIKHAIPMLRARGGGSIVNVGSIEGFGSNPRHAAYCASKSGLHGLTRAIAVDHGRDNIRCNAVAPGWINTEMSRDFIAAMPDPLSFSAKIGQIHPLGRIGAPEEVASLIVWLASDEGSFVTGQIFTVDGGRMAKLSLPN